VREHPAIKDAALIGKPDKTWGEVGIMIVVLESGGQVSEKELKGHCQGRIAKYKMPKEFIFASELPYSAYGKVEKTKLKEKYLP
jgi:acyl-CoA synthetase (AMP-forming)/AMP-acid ligase II